MDALCAWQPGERLGVVMPSISVWGSILGRPGDWPLVSGVHIHPILSPFSAL